MRFPTVGNAAGSINRLGYMIYIYIYTHMHMKVCGRCIWVCVYIYIELYIENTDMGRYEVCIHICIYVYIYRKSK